MAMTAEPRVRRLRNRLRFYRALPDPHDGKRRSWVAEAVVLVIFRRHLGYVNARGENEALSKARSRWPNERAISVRLKTSAD